MNQNKEIPIMTCFDNNYAIPAGVAFYSLLENSNKDYEYKLYVLHTDITEENQINLQKTISPYKNAALEFINMGNKFNDLFQQTKTKGHYSKEMFYKFLAPSIFPQYDKIIITDVDVVFLGDISELYNEHFPSDNEYFSGSKPMIKKNSWLDDYYKTYKEVFNEDEIQKLTTCGGLWIFNLEKMRQDNCQEKFIKYAIKNSSRLKQPEQDTVNIICYPKIKYFPSNALVCSYLYDLYTTFEDYNNDKNYCSKEIEIAKLRPIQLHFATNNKPWTNLGIIKSEQWIKYLIKTPFCTEYLATLDNRTFFKDSRYFNKRKLLFNSSGLFNNIFKTKINKIRIRKDKREYKYLVSILCCTYNQEKFIKKTIENLLEQKTDFQYEIIISDDASTDKTQNIIQEFHNKYPQIIKPILRKTNVGIGENYYNALSKIQGKYLAICDGDDFWLDKNKLQKEVDFLEKNKHFNIVCSNAKFHYIDENKADKIFNVRKYLPFKKRFKQSYNLKDLLKYRFIASCTVLIRWQMKDNLPIWLKNFNVIDFPLTLIHSTTGRIKVFDEVFAQYNIHQNGISRQEQTAAYQKQIKDIIKNVNNYTEKIRDKEISEYLINYGE